MASFFILHAQESHQFGPTSRRWQVHRTGAAVPGEVALANKHKLSRRRPCQSAPVVKGVSQALSVFEPAQEPTTASPTSLKVATLNNERKQRVRSVLLDLRPLRFWEGHDSSFSDGIFDNGYVSCCGPRVRRNGHVREELTETLRLGSVKAENQCHLRTKLDRSQEDDHHCGTDHQNWEVWTVNMAQSSAWEA